MRIRQTDRIRGSDREENEKKVENKPEWEKAETRSCVADPEEEQRQVPVSHSQEIVRGLYATFP